MSKAPLLYEESDDAMEGGTEEAGIVELYEGLLGVAEKEEELAGEEIKLDWLEDGVLRK